MALATATRGSSGTPDVSACGIIDHSAIAPSATMERPNRTIETTRHLSWRSSDSTGSGTGGAGCGGARFMAPAW
jgi:hypothetical protein